MGYRRPEVCIQEAIADVRVMKDCGVLKQKELGICAVQQMLARLTMFADPEIQTRMLAAIGGPSSVAEAALIVGWGEKCLQ